MALSPEEIKAAYGEHGAAGTGFFGKTKKILTSPDAFFNSVRDESGVKSAFVCFAVTSLIGAVINFIIFFTVFGAISAAIGVPVFGGFGFASFFLLWAAGLLLIFAGAAIFHIFVIIFGGRNGYTSTFKAIAYGAVPYNIFSWIPLLGLIFGLWSLYLFIKGISVLHDINMGKAAAAVLLPVIIIFAVSFIFSFSLMRASYSPGLSPNLPVLGLPSNLPTPGSPGIPVPPVGTGASRAGSRPTSGSVQAVHFNELIPFLPSPLPGWTAGEASGMIIPYEGSVSVAEREYNKPDEKVKILIGDTANLSIELIPFIFDVGFGIETQTSRGYGKKVTINGYPGFEWFRAGADEIPDRYVLHVRLRDRFIVRTEANDRNTAYAYANAINYAGIAALS